MIFGGQRSQGTIRQQFLQIINKMADKRCQLVLLFVSAVMAVSSVNASTSYQELADCLPVSCPDAYDVVVMLDRSGSVNGETFDAFVELIKKLLGVFNIKAGGNRFGLLLYNDDPEVAMKLVQNNDAAFIENYLTTNLPGRSGNRNVRRAFRETRQELLTLERGDRPGVPNICILMTTENGVRNNDQFPKLREVCDKFVVLDNGGDGDLQKVRDKVCPISSEDDAKDRTEDFCSDRFPCNSTCNGTDTGPCPPYYIQVHGYCLQLVLSDDLDYFQCIEDCALRHGGRLVTIDTAEKNEAVLEYLTARNLTTGNDVLVFIGLRDQVGNNNLMDYRWIHDNSSLTFQNWYEGEPLFEEEECVAISVASELELGIWLDEGCPYDYDGCFCEADPL